MHHSRSPDLTPSLAPRARERKVPQAADRRLSRPLPAERSDDCPDGQRSRLLAVFSSAFKYKDGHGRFSVNGRDFFAVYTRDKNGDSTVPFK